MPKMKSHSGAAKRFRKTKSGKIKVRSTNRAHILTPKSTKRKRQARKAMILTAPDRKTVQGLLPYS